MTFFVTDIECDGPLTGVHSLRSIGSVAVTKELVKRGTFYVNIAPHFHEDEDTVRWWKQWPRARQSLEKNQRQPGDAMAEFVQWLEKFTKPWIFISDTDWFDYPWIVWYLKYYLNQQFVFAYQIDFTKQASYYGIELPAIQPAMPHNALSDALALAEQFIGVWPKIRKEK